jgi:HEAT repeat protein
MAELYKTIYWEQFDDFKGSWDFDFRSLFENLNSVDPAERKRARETLSQWPHEILDQMGRLGAVPLALQCLLDDLASPGTEERDELLALIVQTARDSKEFVRFSAWHSGSGDQLLSSIRRVFESGEGLYLRLLDADDPKLRAASAEALGLIGSKSLASPLVKRLHLEDDDRVSQSLVVSLRACGSIEDVAEVLKRLGSTNEVLKESVAATVCKLVGPDYFQSLGILADVVTIGIDVDKAKDEFVELMQTRAMSSAIEDLQTLGEFALNWAVEWWLSKISDVSANNIIPFFRRIVMATFPMNDGIHHQNRTALLPFQIKVLTAINQSDLFWDVKEFFNWRHSANRSLANAEYYRNRCLEEIGVPTSREELNRYLSECQ